MNQFIEWISQPWPWYVAGPMIGLTVPALLILGNKAFGISSSLRHICAACAPAGIPFFTYNWKKEIWNLLFVFGTAIGGFIAVNFLANPDTIVISRSDTNGLESIGTYQFFRPNAIRNFQLGYCIYREGSFILCDRGIPRWIWDALRRRMYLWPLNYGNQCLAVAFLGGYHLLHARWVFHDPRIA